MGRLRIAVLHHERSFFPLDLHEAIWQDVDPLWVVTEPPSEPSTLRLLRRLGEVVDISGLDLDEAAKALWRARPDGIVTFVDDHLVLASLLADRLGLRFHAPEDAMVLADKRRQRAALMRAGVPGPRHWALPAAAEPGDLGAALDAVRYPAVLKQAHGMGSRHMQLVTNRAQLAAVVAEEPFASDGGVVEEYLEDDPGHDDRFASYLSVESVVTDRRTEHVAFCGRFPLAEPFRETGNFIPAVVTLAQQLEILDVVDGAIGALAIRSAVIHTEIKLTPRGPALIEVNGRLGGRPPFVLRRVSDVNLHAVACRVAAGAPLGVSGRPACSGVGYWLMLQPPVDARRVVAMEGVEGLSRAEDVDSVAVRRRAGEAVDWREGTDGNVMVVRGAVPDHDTLADTIARIRGSVRVEYERERVLQAS